MIVVIIIRSFFRGEPAFLSNPNLTQLRPTLSLSLSYTLSYTLRPTLSLSLSYTLSVTMSYTPSFALSLPLFLCIKVLSLVFEHSIDL